MSRAFRPPKSWFVKGKIQAILKPKEGECYIVNRNPRNLENLRIAYKPGGYHLEKPGRSFWHKLDLHISSRYVTAEVRHFENGPVINAATSEWVIKKQLYKTKDTAAFINLGRVLAARCLQAGITEMECNIDATPYSKISKFLDAIKEGGVILIEPPQFKKPQPWDAERHENPWDVVEDPVL